MIKAVLFDLFETLVTERHLTPVRASSLGERLGLDSTAFRARWRSQRPRVLRGQLSLADALIEIGVALGRRLDPAVVRSVCEQRRREKSLLFDRIDPDTLGGLGQLRECRMKLAVVSNCFAEDVAGWAECAAAPCFDASVFSFDVGAAKPESRIYSEALCRVGVEPAEALFVGDGGDDELLGAERAGLRAAQAAWFRGHVCGVPPGTPRLSSWQAALQFVTAG